MAPEQLFDLRLDHEEQRDLAGSARHAGTKAALRERLESWMRETRDPLLEGAVPAPDGALVNEQWQVSPEEPLRSLGGSSG